MSHRSQGFLRQLHHRLYRGAGMLVLLPWLLAGEAGAQLVPDTVVTAAQPVAHFDAARALAADPLGRLYVADAGADVIVRLDPARGLREQLGGPGTGEGAFDDPADVDPTNGLVIVVADAGNNRLQRFSREFRHLESLPVRRVDALSDDLAGQPTYRRDDPALASYADGRPVSVAVTSADETFVVDDAQGVVIKWDAARRVARLIGGFDAGAGQLADPVSLALAEDYLFVADAGRAAVLVYDLFGRYVRAIAEGQAPDVRAVAAAGGRLWIVLPKRLLVYTPRGRLERVVDVRLPAPLVDVAQAGGHTYLLTASRLYRADL